MLLPEQFVKSGDSDNQLVSPLSRCPCCSFKLRGGTQDCMFKACRSNRQDSHADIDDFVGRGVNITPNEMEQRQKEIETKTGKKASNKPTAADTCVTNYASDNDRAKQRFMNDIQALGGFACRHGIILYSFFIRTGERYGYFHCVLSRLQEDAATYGFEIPDTLVVHYDVACRFAIYMRNRSTGEWMPTYCTGKLHGITHSLLCQLRNMGLYTPGAGNSCGEQLEQAWSQVGKNWQLVRSYEPFRYVHWQSDR